MAFLRSSLVTLSCSEMSWAKKRTHTHTQKEKLLSKSKKHFKIIFCMMELVGSISLMSFATFVKETCALTSQKVRVGLSITLHYHHPNDFALG